ncbi:MAG: hypothetical protein TREMPRED_003625 [Tremellales sp. Tagirdzhanova-0007]|nr:MAG: hypothetical protein TREMPRED_003625 [Tremellales sp. Tagirdzhanova-0007]
MSGLLKLLQAVSPPQSAGPSRHYDGYELRWKAFVFRPALFAFEATMLGIMATYILVYVVGRTINQSRAKAAQVMIAPYKPLLDSQFAATRPLLSSGPSLHLLYSSGRRNVLCLHTTLTLLPLHDLVGLLYRFGRSIVDPTHDISEGILFELTLGRGDAGLQSESVGVWAVVDKDSMRQTREKRWDLVGGPLFPGNARTTADQKIDPDQTFPRLHETSNVPMTHALFTEHSDCTDALLKTPSIGIPELLGNPSSASVLKYLLISDVSSRRPVKGPLPVKYRSRAVVLAVHKPSNPTQEKAVKAWLQVALNVADLLVKPNLLKPEVSRKLQGTRKTVDADLSTSYNKEQAEDKPAEETAEDKRFAKKRAERAAMSEKELKRVEDLDKKREMRKLQKKQAGK